MNVALLKLGSEAIPPHACRPVFPRSDERGSIEAVAIKDLINVAVLFPRSDERGSIEARLYRLPAPHQNRLVSTFG